MIILTPDARYKFYARDNDKDDEAVVKESFVENVYDIHRGLLNDTGIVIDIGANIGAVTLHCLSLDEGDKELPRIKVYAIEPEPKNLELLHKNLEVNKAGKAVEVLPIAVWGERKTLEITNQSGGSTVVDEPNEKVKRTRVEAITLEDVYADNKIVCCDLLKVDVEGAEYSILLNAPDHILTKAQHIRIEFDQRTTDYQFGALITKLCKNYNVHIIGSPERGGNIYASRY